MAEIPQFLTFYMDARLAGMQNRRRKTADIHIHTRLPYGSDGMLDPEEVLDAALRAKLDTIAVTDHDQVNGAARVINKWHQRHMEKDLTVLFGQEVTTDRGHLLVVDHDEYLLPHLPLQETIKQAHRLKSDGTRGMVFAAHPGLPLARALRHRDIQEVMDSDDPEVYFDGMEIFNNTAHELRRLDGGAIFPESNLRNLAFYRANADHRKIGAAVGNTDAHTRKLGKGRTGYYEDTFREAVASRGTEVIYERQPLLEEVKEAVLFVGQGLRWQLHMHGLSKAA